MDREDMVRDLRRLADRLKGKGPDPRSPEYARGRLVEEAALRISVLDRRTLTLEEKTEHQAHLAEARRIKVERMCVALELVRDHLDGTDTKGKGQILAVVDEAIAEGGGPFRER